MKEANRLAAAREFGQLKSLLKGAFLGTSILLLIALAIAGPCIPFFGRSMGVKDTSVIFLAVAASFLGCFAPVYQDALNGLKRFGAYSIAEVASATARVGVMLVIMPFQALFGFFAGNAAQPITRIAASLLALRKSLAVPTEPYWNNNPIQRLAPLFFGVLTALAMPMIVSLEEQSLIRALAPEISAEYYLMTRLSDLLNYLTLPILLVLFPYAAEAAEKGESTKPLVLKSTLAALLGAIILGSVYAVFGDALLGLLNRLNHATSALPPSSFILLTALLAANLLTAFQVFYTNAEIAAGRFRFLYWFVPIHLVYALLLSNLPLLNLLNRINLPNLINLSLAFAALRALFVLYDIIRRK